MSIMVILVERKNILNILIFSSFVWMLVIGITVCFAGISTGYSDAILILWRIAYIGIILTPAIILHLTAVILSEQKPVSPAFLRFIYLISFFFILLDVFWYLVVGIYYSTSWNYYDTIISDWWFSFIGFLFITLLYSIFISLWYYKKVSHPQQRQIFFFFTSLFIGTIGGIFFYLPVFGFNQYKWWTIILAWYPWLLWYAVLRYQFFDMSNAVLRVLRLFSSMIFSIVILTFILYFVFGAEVLTSVLTLKLAVLYFFGNVFSFLIYQADSTKTFFSPKDRQILKASVNAFLNETKVSDTVQDIEKILRQYFIHFVKNGKISLYDRIEMEKYKKLIEYFSHRKTPIIRDTHDYFWVASNIDAEIIFPLYSSGRHVIGFFTIWKKQSEKVYTQEDINLLSQMLLKISLALQILDHNHDLRMQVQERTQELTQKNNELAKAYENLKEVDANKDTFLAIASHELRTPMTIIKWYSDMLSKWTFWQLNEKQKKYMTQIYTSTEELISFVNNILDISKLEAGRMVFTYEHIDHHEHIKNIINNFTSLYLEKNIPLILTDNSKTDTLYTDKSKLTLILNNLLSNAYKFTPQNGKVEVLLTDCTRKGNSFLKIIVNDSGIGMNKETLAHIFEKFSQSSNQDYTKKSIQGSGLGLHLIHEVIVHFGGEILVDSTQNAGTRVTVFLPYSILHS